MTTNYGAYPQSWTLDKADRDGLIERTFNLEDQVYAEKVREAIAQALDITEARDVWRTMVQGQVTK